MPYKQSTKSSSSAKQKAVLKIHWKAYKFHKLLQKLLQKLLIKLGKYMTKIHRNKSLHINSRYGKLHSGKLNYRKLKVHCTKTKIFWYKRKLLYKNFFGVCSNAFFEFVTECYVWFYVVHSIIYFLYVNLCYPHMFKYVLKLKIIFVHRSLVLLESTDLSEIISLIFLKRHSENERCDNM